MNGKKLFKKFFSVNSVFSVFENFWIYASRRGFSFQSATFGLPENLVKDMLHSTRRLIRRRQFGEEVGVNAARVVVLQMAHAQPVGRGNDIVVTEGNVNATFTVTLSHDQRQSCNGELRDRERHSHGRERLGAGSGTATFPAGSKMQTITWSSMAI